jgi:TonB family protein
VDYLVLAYTSPELGDACIEALKGWKFAPPTFRGEPVSLQRELTFDFDSKGSVLTFDLASYVGFMTTRVLGGLKMNFRPRTLKEIDRIPTPVHTNRPIAPKGVTGQATVEFYIDTQGAVRMPSLVQADTPELGDAAAAAVRQWHFDPPMFQGQPTLVRVQQTFRFQP